MDTFDIAAGLPRGTTLLEASAGTGKTWAIAALVTRYVAEGAATLDELLVVTFTRAASQELRERVRAQLLTARDAIVDPASRPTDSRLLDWLLAADPAELELRRQRLTQALTGFDAATIATIHQFCQLVLRSLGVAGDTDADAVLVEDLEQVTRETVDDLFLSRFHGDSVPAFSHAVARQIGRAVMADPQASIEPLAVLSDDPESPAAERVKFATYVRDEVDRRKRRLGVLSYDDLLSQLARALAETDSPARTRMRQRWKVALIDEFQDTDPVQWEVFERAFHGHSTLVLIGDPKQAIYAFRGGDVATYLHAAALADTHQTLSVNWRSDKVLVDALQALLDQAALGDDQIRVQPVRAHHSTARLAGAGAPLRLRAVRRQELGVGPREKPRVDAWRGHVVADVAHDIARQLSGDARLEGRPLTAGDFAIVARRNVDLEAMHAALTEVGVPSVVNTGGSVFHTPAATEWLVLLEALDQPHRGDRVRAAALTPFIGRTAADLDTGDVTDELAERVRTMSDTLAARGVAAVLEMAIISGLTERVLAKVSGERSLTDLRHIGEALHKVAVEERLGVVGLLAWLREQVAESKYDVSSERTRRLDSDAASVQLVTIHGSKGLQYPIVYAPTLWDRYTGREPEIPLFHDDEGRRCIDVSGTGPQRRANLDRYWSEDDGESLRLLYVALTRAQCQLVVHYAPSSGNTQRSPLHRMLFGRRPGAGEAVAAPIPDDAKIAQVLTGWRDAGGPHPEIADIPDVRRSAADGGAVDLGVRTFTRTIDTEWRRTSYSSLSAAATPVVESAALTEPEDVEGYEDDAGATFDVGAVDDVETPTDPDLLAAAVVSPMAELPVGATFGSLVHAVLEHADPTVEDFRAELLGHIREQSDWWRVPGLDADGLADALVQVCDSPLGPLVDDMTLRGFAMVDRLRELDFELPLSGGDAASRVAASVRLGDLGPLLRRHLPDGDPVRQYADVLAADPALAGQPLRGYLNGSIDVVLRVGGADPRFLTVDYKTNWLGDRSTPLSAYDYRPAALADAMSHSDYPLQALLYTAVLHRFLRWRLPEYDPDLHLGGVLYLYLRGMCGPDTPRVDGQPCGVFSWRPPSALVVELSDLLDGRLAR